MGVAVRSASKSEAESPRASCTKRSGAKPERRRYQPTTTSSYTSYRTVHTVNLGACKSPVISAL